MGRIEGKTAIISGAGGGIGSATARRLAAEGASVVVADIDDVSGARVVDSIVADGGRALFAHLDVTDRASFESVASIAMQEFGRLDILHNNAAGTHLYGVDRDLLSVESTDWDQIMSLNARSILFGCQAVLPHMMDGSGGAIINMSSTRAELGAMDLPVYGASKSAVDTLTKYVATQYGRQGIRCNSIQPGLIVTAQSRALHAGGDGVATVMRHVSAPEPGSPEDIAALVLFLGSDEARYITGQTIRVDGGMLSRQPFVTTTE